MSRNFKEYPVWQRARELNKDIYSLNLPYAEKKGLIDQIQRASVSISSNIAEGCGRNSDKDFLRFLHISLGSTNETLYLLILSKDLKLITEEIFKELEDEVEKVKAMLLAFIKTINNRLA